MTDGGGRKGWDGEEGGRPEEGETKPGHGVGCATQTKGSGRRRCDGDVIYLGADTDLGKTVSVPVSDRCPNTVSNFHYNIDVICNTICARVSCVT